MLKYWILQNKELVFMTIVSFMFFVLLLSEKKPEVVVIAVDKYGTRILGNKKADQDLRDIEITQFIDEFVGYYFNFDETNYKDRISFGIGYLSQDLWENQEVSQFEALDKEIMTNPFKEKSRISKIEYLEESDKFKIDIISELTSNKITKNKTVKLNIGVKSIERSKKNPWGLEINALQRIY